MFSRITLMSQRLPVTMKSTARLLSTSSLTVHGHYVSQPARSVLWLLKINNEVRLALYFAVTLLHSMQPRAVAPHSVFVALLPEDLLLCLRFFCVYSLSIS
jgi:hypothetical protein